MAPTKTLGTRLRLAPRQLRWLLSRTVRGTLGLPTVLHSEDRRLMEQEILPWFAARSQYGRVLFVGCDWYTRHYEHVFRDRDYCTLEREPRRRQFGARSHVTACVTNVAEHYPSGHFQLICFNGVLGWGIDNAKQADRALCALASVLDKDGVLVVGWNDVEERRVIDPDASMSSSGLSRWVFPPWNASRRLVQGLGRHTYNFYFRRVLSGVACGLVESAEWLMIVGV